jgi:hypothetical protein
VGLATTCALDHGRHAARVLTGVKSLGCDTSSAHFLLALIHLWKSMGPSVESAWKFGTVSPMRNAARAELWSLTGLSGSVTPTAWQRPAGTIAVAARARCTQLVRLTMRQRTHRRAGAAMRARWTDWRSIESALARVVLSANTTQQN